MLDVSLDRKWKYGWVTDKLREHFDKVVWKEFDYGNTLTVAVFDKTYRNAMQVEYSYIGPKAIGHWELAPNDCDEYNCFDQRYDENGIKWIWLYDFYDYRRWSLIMQDNPEAIVQSFITLAKSGATIN